MEIHKSLLKIGPEKNGLKDTTKCGKVEIRQIDNTDLKALLEKGKIDAALVPEPCVGANVVLDYNKLLREGNYSTAVVVARKDFIKKHSDIVEGFLKTNVEITSTMTKDNEEVKIEKY
ncbi:hypothetical protein OD350_26445 [Clostridium beijerinckii]|uniref:hypothetical protein n=1 Tax=Clostridium beijerinckii TaxID=1520 RepID=UPI0014944A59|nr:hypothetical protein [Clostridium beijerinckii]NOW07516.1 ABC-type nitrate/sulfonate/bicarbonate transport system substrate-binding protein [Clostridium beijerinckii]NYC04711.1 ABC-type nitrate/sulfonate/bicarbonate transport system substrate-binding protein [Clostridium beijerinckii]UYZ35683.1 hypothetical protein OD350_26445 [Clostridium beijerinckii]